MKVKGLKFKVGGGSKLATKAQLDSQARKIKSRVEGFSKKVGKGV